MFIDRVKISVKGGDGGNGAVSFYRAKFVTNGGPDGGDGGKGGDLIFETDGGMTTLMDFRYKRKFAAQNGEPGGKRNCSGKSGEDVVIRVPVGTVIKEAESNKVMADLSKLNERRVLIAGGKGGKGNQNFATSVRQAPRYAEAGKKAKAYDIILELKLIADAGLIGFPNVGKSTILSMVTNATPKIANYHFTTLSPNLGVVRNKWGEDFVLADIPGLIEGASEGLGLGHEFLRHVERTKVLIHVVDASGLEGDPVSGIEKINGELIAFNEKLAERPQIIVANKMDLMESADHFENIEKYCKEKNLRLIPISAVSNEGLDELIMTVWDILKHYPEQIVFEEDFEEYKEIPLDKEPFTIVEQEKGFFIVTGVGVEKMIGFTDIDTEKGFAFFQKYLRDRGIIAELENMGIKDGDSVRIYNIDFDYYK